MKTYYIYTLKLRDETLYTGVTNNIRRRLSEHKLGLNKDSYVSKRLPFELIYLCNFNDINQAIEREKQIKGWTRRKKQALVNGDFDLLKEL